MEEHFSGSVASFRMYDIAVDAAGATALMNGTDPADPAGPALRDGSRLTPLLKDAQV